jgi:predicted ATP-dependent protease
MRELNVEELRASCDPKSLGFQSTEELPILDGMIGQERALTATQFGIGVKHVGYNLFVLGPPATGKTTTMQRLLAKTAEHEPVATDLCYVHNFSDAYRPTALDVPAGRGRELQRQMACLVEECKVKLPRAFEGEEFERQKSQILADLARRQETEVGQLEDRARAVGFVVVRTPTGFGVAPAPKGKPLDPDEFSALPAAVQERLGAAARELQQYVDATLRQLRQVEREAGQAHEKLVSEVAAAVTRHLIGELRDNFTGLDAVQRYFNDVEKDLIAHAEEFRGSADGKPTLPFLPPPGAFLDRYRVNVLVDRSQDRGAPVVIETNSTHGNLLGKIEHRAHFGTLVTDFMLIRPGALHRANGGYLILEVKDLLRNFLAWESLKKALKGGSIRIEEPLEEYRLVTAASLAPEPISLSVKVVLIGSPLLYYLLYNLDEDFGELFKVKVDFDDSFERTHETELLYARFVAGSCREHKLAPFSADGIARLIEHGSRMVAHQQRLSSRLGVLLDVVRDASFYATERGHGQVTGDDVDHAIGQKVYRANLVEERVGRMIQEGTLLIATDGAVVGQVNGISGSVNQRGEIQPVGGINEKIEGFFDVCRARGLTGREGVLIPATNVRHLMLRRDVVDAVREQKFHIHAASAVDDALEILSGRPAGERMEPGAQFPVGSFNAAVEHALAESFDRFKALRGNSHGIALARSGSG